MAFVAGLDGDVQAELHAIAQEQGLSIYVVRGTMEAGGGFNVPDEVAEAYISRNITPDKPVAAPKRTRKTATRENQE